MKTEFINILSDKPNKRETVLTQRLSINGAWGDGCYVVSDYCKVIYLGEVAGVDRFVCYKSSDLNHPYFFRGIKGSEFI